VVTDKQTDRQTYDGDSTIPRESFRGDNKQIIERISVWLLQASRRGAGLQRQLRRRRLLGGWQLGPRLGRVHRTHPDAVCTLAALRAAALVRTTSQALPRPIQRPTHGIIIIITTVYRVAR